jgi:iron-sulfur cluster assembly protein
MITITQEATEQVREVLSDKEKEGHALRVFVRGMSCSGPAYGMALDNEPRSDDSVIDLGGIKVLVDPASAPYLDGAEIDFVDTLMGRGFTVTNPNAPQQEGGGCGGGCSCGSGGGH